MSYNAVISPPPPKWRKGMPPSPPKGKPPSKNYFRRSSATSGETQKPGLVNMSEESPSKTEVFFKNASQIMVEDKKKSTYLEQTYKSPPRMLSTVLQKSKVFELDEIHIKTLQTIFMLLDNDQDKMLDINQLRTAIIAMGIPPSQKLIQEVLRNVPEFKKRDGPGVVDFHTFKTVLTDRLQCNPVHMTDIDELFKLFQTPSDDGFISDQDLRHVMQVETTNNTNLTDDEVDQIFSELHLARGTKVDHRDFIENISSGFVHFQS